MKLNDLREQRALRVAEARALVDKAGAEKRNLTADEQKAFDGLKASITDLEAQEQRAAFMADVERRAAGDPVDDRSSIVTIPSFTHTSVERFKEWGDRRIYETYHLESRASQSYILKDGAKSTNDLSPDLGIQQGRFRVYLTVARTDFSRHNF